MTACRGVRGATTVEENTSEAILSATRELLVEMVTSNGICPEDVASDNTIRHTQIAEARISYGGRGSISAVQRPNWGQRIGDAITPW